MRLVIVVAVVAALAVLAVWALDRPVEAKRTPSVLRARTIELVDARGEVRAQMKVERGGEVVFRLRDEDGAIRLKLGASRSGAGLLLLDEATQPGIQALAGEDETSIAVERDGRRRVVVP